MYMFCTLHVYFCQRNVNVYRLCQYKHRVKTAPVSAFANNIVVFGLYGVEDRFKELATSKEVQDNVLKTAGHVQLAFLL
jgi:hypothetical protein